MGVGHARDEWKQTCGGRIGCAGHGGRAGCCAVDAALRKLCKVWVDAGAGAVRRYGESLGGQEFVCCYHGAAGDPELPGEHAGAGQVVAGRQHPGVDEGADLSGDLGGEGILGVAWGGGGEVEGDVGNKVGAHGCYPTRQSGLVQLVVFGSGGKPLTQV